MLISHSKKFVFVHIFKTAGTSVSRIFLPYSRIIERITYQYFLTQKIIALYARTFKLENEGQSFITGYHKHATSSEIISKMGLDTFNKYFTFCFVRNPYDHMVSLYHYIKESRGHYLHAAAQAMSFDEFILYYIQQKPQTQSEFVFIGPRKAVQFVGRFEQLESDLRTICSHVGVPFPKLKHANSSNRIRDYLAYYQNAESVQAFNDYFAIDFRQFNYPQIDPNNLITAPKNILNP